ncbi:MAG TPA: YihY/virulence factor BrkB family protein [Propionibacteriaceae bacterium]|nr:YihY/virulence factor BrkB family protein [Propionibacteriaceae bacterium]
MSARTDPDGASERVESAPRALSRAGRAWRVIADTAATCVRYRVTGLAAEAAFFGVLSLPPLIFGLAGAIGFFTSTLDIRTLAGFRGQLVDLSARVLTPDVVKTVIEPTIDDVLSRGNAGVISIGFLIALWSGSRALNVFVDTITIMYGMAGKRGLVRTRALSFVLYLVFLVAGIVLLPLILAGPSLVSRVVPPGLEFIGSLYWPVVLLGSVCMLASLYHLSVPTRTRWRADLPGAAITVAMWIGGSVLLRLVLSKSVGSPTIYGPLAAPVAFLIWLYVMSIAVLIGAALNAGLDDVFPRLSGIDHDAPGTDKPSANKTEGNSLRRTLAGVRARRRVKSQ